LLKKSGDTTVEKKKSPEELAFFYLAIATQSSNFFCHLQCFGHTCSKNEVSVSMLSMLKIRERGRSILRLKVAIVSRELDLW